MSRHEKPNSIDGAHVSEEFLECLDVDVVSFRHARITGTSELVAFSMTRKYEIRIQ